MLRSDRSALLAATIPADLRKMNVVFCPVLIRASPVPKVGGRPLELSKLLNLKLIFKTIRCLEVGSQPFPENRLFSTYSVSVRCVAVVERC